MEKNGFCMEYQGKRKIKQIGSVKTTAQTQSNYQDRMNNMIGQIALTENGSINVINMSLIFILIYSIIKYAFFVMNKKIKGINAHI